MDILALYLAAHDSSAALISGGKVYGIELERLSRIKHSCDHELLTREYIENRVAHKPEHVVATGLEAMDYLMRAAGRTGVDATMTCQSRGARWLDDPKAPVVRLTHHKQHATSAFYPSGYDESAVLVLDNFGERDQTNRELRETVSIWHGRGREVRHVRTISSPAYQFAGQPDDVAVHHSPGNFYTDCTVISGFKVLDGGKTMGLSPYGTDRLLAPLLKFVTFRDDGRIDFDRGYQQMLRDDLAARGNTFEAQADVAYAGQEVLERCVMYYARLAHELTGSTNVCLAGGIALNAVANGKILANTKFKKLFVQPAAKDSGLSLGKALAAFYHFDDNHPIDLDYRGYCLGAPYEYGATVAKARTEPGLEVTSFGDDALYAATAKLLAAGKIVAWFQGGCEFGPRALGHRSILANPTIADMKDVLNSRVKHREAFRPFAPSILEEEVGGYFDLDGLEPYMLRCATVTSAAIPAVTHVDRSARLQTVSRSIDERFHKLITAFRAASGVPVLLNTSFNVRGQPIVETPDQALACFQGTGIDALVLGDHLIAKRQ